MNRETFNCYTFFYKTTIFLTHPNSNSKCLQNDSFKITKIIGHVLKRTESIVGRGENVSPFPTTFSEVLFPKIVETWNCAVKN